jgi:hypothetical protein
VAWGKSTRVVGMAAIATSGKATYTPLPNGMQLWEKASLRDW